MSEASDRDRLIEEALKRLMQRSMPAADSACLEPERLAAWAGGALPPDEATRVEQHLADCSRCQEIVAVFARTEAAARVPVAPGRIWSVLWRPLPVAALAVAAALVIWMALPRTPASLEDRTARVAPPAMPVAPPSSSAGADKPAARAQAAAPVQAPPAAASSPALAEPVAIAAPVSTVAEFAAASAEDRADAAKSMAKEISQSEGRASGRTAAEAAAPQRSIVQAPAPAVRWRILSSGRVQRSATNGESWEPIAIDPPAIILAGTAPTPEICWLVGRGGVVLFSPDAMHFTRVTSPTQADLTSVQARSAREATITAADGRIFTTDDGGASWR